MIATLAGEIISLDEDSLVVAVGGIGLRVYAPAPLKDKSHLGERTFLYTYLVVRQDALTLYGFGSEEERNFFRLLLGVDGVGPRLALALLSTLPVDTIRRAVLSEQADVFARVPGVGKKTAQKVVLYLQGKVGEGILIEGSPTLDVDTQVLEALATLGYSVVEAQAAIQSIARDAPQDVETRLRLALQYFST
ncbi:MAG: Holliday junction branch migration protein RuvA [Chloroflexi bacterium]|nr:Holliday junction branch migration protein RuvA [Chloroflexota bacterium]